MDAAEALLLARAQFGLNISFHILFPSLTIALAWFLLLASFKVAEDEGWNPAVTGVVCLAIILVAGALLTGAVITTNNET